MRKTSVIYFIVSFLVFVYLVRFALGPLVFVAIAPQIPALCFVLFPVIFLLLTHFSPAEIIRAFKLAGRKSNGTKSELKNAVLFFKTARQFFITITVIGMIILWIWYLAGGSDKTPTLPLETVTIPVFGKEIECVIYLKSALYR